MNARNKKFLSMILAMFLVLQFLPFNTFAADEEVQMSGREAVDYALFSASRENALLLNGSRISIKGDVHTNADFVYQGSELVIDGVCEASGKVSAKNAKALITKEIECAPIIEMSDYTTEIKTIASENAEIFEADQKYHGNSIVFEKSIIANGSIFVNGSKFTTNDYIIATKDISINVAKSEIGFKDGSVICSETGNITFNGSEVNIKGIIYAPKGTVTINSGIFTLKGRLLANKIIFRGSTLNVQSSKEDIDLIYRETDIIFDQIRNEYECNIEHKISFTIVDKFGKPVPNVICSISVTGNATAPSSVTTNSDGRATIIISDSMNESITLTITTKKGLSKSIVLNFVKNQAIINLYIVDNNNLPVSGAQITVLSLDSAADNASKVFYSNEQGIADFSLPEGNYTFKIGKDNYKQVVYEKISLTAGNVYSNTIILQKLLNEIFVQYKTILTNQPVKNRISVKVLYEKNQLRSETQNSTPVELFMMNASGEWLSKGFLFDNGNLSINGDEIKADQVYTNIFDFNETQQGKLRLKIVVYRADGTQISK
ncbi:hypothetical protein Calkro_1728 [Caldicellulosiruptor kronotskyensis 2002]|uniref:Big-1 domain-containing protein n=1 Tax=Caldicellulosiruptor kronotskyensis (strain DSM 18902 / VKM B-2412 / 2002) TaxID=632348 RepID=E4SFQ4_CALK2|nr:carboxypeptidase regulatory-like domain-containing protein [Caldicellulosiruptor kronotskyensis]ADQ46579.1 hypothetical protein Calkro_1728 [Caldicellulosiruptor kronotskyensis 2002]